MIRWRTSSSAMARDHLQDSLPKVVQDIVTCTHCPRLRRYCEEVARLKKRAYRDEVYWGKPVHGFGDPKASLLIVGLAPAAHGGNRTGRVFTGDSSGHFLFRALYKVGLASQPISLHRDDGLKLSGVYITAVLHCAPPKNKPQPIELERCRTYLIREWALLSKVRAVLTLGKIAFDGYLAALKQTKKLSTHSALRFRHGSDHDLGLGLPRLFASYHPSRQNTNTGRLTEAMFDAVLFQICRFLRESR